MNSSHVTIKFRHLSIWLGVFFFFSCETESAEIDTKELISDKSESSINFYRIGPYQLDSFNLSTTTFMNGEAIRRAQTREDWLSAAKNKEAAYCRWVGDSNVVLYNFYALTDSRGLVNPDQLISLEDAKKMEEGFFNAYFSDDEPTVERNYTGRFYDLELINWWVNAENDSACVMTWKPDGTDMKLQQVSKANGFCIRTIRR